MEPEHPVQLQRGEAFCVTLPGWGSAGYQWSWDVRGEAGVIDVHLDKEGIPPVTAPGTPRTNFSREEQATVRALGPGQVMLRFCLRRPWERDVPPRDERRYLLTVT